MRNFCFLILAFSSHFASSQRMPDDFESFPIASISSDNLNFSDLEFLKAKWNDKKYVLLGEQSHGDGATFSARVRLIKFLHQEMGFSMVAFESGMYDNYKAYKSFTDDSSISAPFNKSILDLWSDTRSFQELVAYVSSTQNTSRPLRIAGFDFIRSKYFKNLFVEDLRKVLGNLNEIETIEPSVVYGAEFLAEDLMDTTSVYNAAETIQKLLGEKAEIEKTEYSKMLQQTFSAWFFGLKYEVGEISGKEYSVQNPRDRQMAENFIFLSELYPDEKIIGIGASMHFANSIDEIQNTAITSDYAQAVFQPEDSAVFNVEEEVKGAIPMGQLLKKKYGDAVELVAFASSSGSFGMVGGPTYHFDQFPKESLEFNLSSRADTMSVVFLDQQFEGYSFFLSSLGNIPVLNEWSSTFDCLVYLKHTLPPKPAEYEEVRSLSSKESSKSVFGRVVDADTKEEIPFVNIALLSTSKGTSSNEKGYFVFNDSRQDEFQLVFSSIGYENDTISLSFSSEEQTIQLQPKGYLLNEVVVLDKPLTAKDIVRLAREKREENYFQNPLNQEFFFSTTHFVEDSMVFNEESAVLLYSDKGYKSTNNPAAQFYGEILSYRNTTGNETKNKWQGVGSMWLVLTHDVIFDKANVLNRTSAYELQMNGIREFEDQFVYEIEFDCKRPSSTTVGFGYPAPESAKGKIFINTSDFGVVKYEVCIPRKPSTNKKYGFTMSPWGHNLVQTYKRYKGKYFLNTSISYNHYFYDYEEKEDYNYSFISILNSTQIETEDIQAIKRPIQSIAVGKIKRNNPAFWDSFNFLIPNKEKPNFSCE